MDLDAIIAHVASAVGIAEGEAGVGGVIQAIARREPVSIRTLSRETELPVPIVAAICNELRKQGVVAQGRPVHLEPQARARFSSPGLRLVPDCPTCDGLGLVEPPELAELHEQLDALVEDAPPVRVDIDQSHCTVETKLRRVLAMHAARALLWRRVLFIGDDDLTSLTLAHVARRYDFESDVREIAVVELDEAVVSFLASRLRSTSVATTLLRHDLRQPLPAELQGRFDTVFTDPPYTAAGAALFLSRAVSALRPGGGDIFLAFGARNPAELVRTQAAIAEMGLVVRSVVRHFNEYVGAGILGGTSHLYHLVATTATQPAVVSHYDGQLYTGDAPRAPRTYVCMQCGLSQLVGRGERATTIGELQALGCPRCQGSSFRPGSRRR